MMKDYKAEEVSSCIHWDVLAEAIVELKGTPGFIKREWIPLNLSSNEDENRKTMDEVDEY